MGLPLELDPPPAEDPAEVIRRAKDAGAFVVLLHPGLNNLPVGATERLPAFDAVDAVEIYNHNTFGSQPDRADGAYMVDGLLERGRRVLVNYSTQGPRIERLELDGERLSVSTSPAHAIAHGGAGDRWLDATTVLDEDGGPVSEETFDVSAFRGSYCRVTVVDTAAGEHGATRSGPERKLL